MWYKGVKLLLHGEVENLGVFRTTGRCWNIVGDWESLGGWTGDQIKDLSSESPVSIYPVRIPRAKYLKEGSVAAAGALHDIFLPGLTMRCFVVWAGSAMLLSLAISLKRRAGIRLDMSASQADMRTRVCLREEGMMEESTLVSTVKQRGEDTGRKPPPGN